MKEIEIPEGYEARIEGNKVILEPKESEDEMIRKDIIGGLMWQKYNLKSEGPHDNNLILPGFCFTVGEHLAYLEKQKEQKLATLDESIELGLDRALCIVKNAKGNLPAYQTDDGIYECDSAIRTLENLLKNGIEQKPIFKKGDKVIWYDEEFTILDVNETEYNVSGYHLPFSRQNELRPIVQKPAELPKSEDYGIDGLYAAIDILQKTLGEVDGYQTDDGILKHECAISAVKELYEQKPAEWSEEDETCLEYALWCVMKARHFVAKDACDLDACRCAERWLKFLPERFNLHPKQEWSEEDKYILKNIHDFVKENTINPNRVNCAEECLNWLETLPERFNLQPKQEWSDEDEKRVVELKTFIAQCNGFNKANRQKAFELIDALRPKFHWKPSEEQMTALKKGAGYLAEYGKSDDDLVLDTLYDDLKKL